MRPRCHDRCGGGVAGCEQHVPCWHQQTTQHSMGKEGGGAAIHTACECDTLLPLSHQRKQASTSLQLLARGRWCGCVKHPFLPLHQHTHTHLMTKRWRSRKGGGRRRSKWDGRGSHQQRQWAESQPHGITAALPCLHTCRVRQRGRGREEVGVSIRCVQITRCKWRAWSARCAATIPNHTPSLSQLHADGMLSGREGEEGGGEEREGQLTHSLSLHCTSSWHTPPFISSPSLSSPFSSLSHTHHTHTHTITST